ncbi:AT-rich interactive domain-containing protein 5B [Stylophora pistillata]|uniref:AT-rich interactive domain-containing protein 5B n=2 Tax=Stylophora pistillata TaxID=50429 RepID=A0A2B4ST74_STYPI|nr:AT-rich interactive domain-containing protein 5B [Stylophora pistillata]
MPVTEVQWIGASCGRHSTYTFYRGFRLIVDGVAKNFCLGEFYFVRNSTDQPICIAELQLVWYDASTDSQLASARLYFRPEDTPAGRLANHGQDELLYADQKVVIKCHDMAVWQNSGLQWNCGMLPVCESDFVRVNDKYYLNSDYAGKEKETLKIAKEAWVERDHPRTLHILTFPAYCRYRALKERLISGMFLTRAQLMALGGIIAEHKSIRVLFCRDSFHHPSLDKFELSGDNKAPVLKGRPRKKKKLAAENNVLKKKRFVADIQNHLENSPAAKRCKVSEGEESTSSDMSEGVQDKRRAPPAVGRKTKTNGPPPLIKPGIQVSDTEKAKTAEILKIAAQDMPLAKVEHTKIPPPLLPSSKIKADMVCLSQPLQSSPKEISANISECSRTTPIQKQVFSSSTKLRDVENSLNIKKTVSLMKPHLTNRVRTNVAVIPASSPSSTSESRTSRLPNSFTEMKKTSNGTAVTYTHKGDNLRTHPAVQADVHSATVLSTRPVTTTQGTISTQPAASTCTVMRSQPVACLPQPISSVQSVPAKSLQNATPIPGPISSSVNIVDVTKSRFSKENGEKIFRTPSVSDEKKENEMEESVMRKKKKKRLREPGNFKDEVYDDDDEKFFMQTLRDFMRKNNQPLGKLPALGFKKVNLWTMYNTVQKFGGYDAVTGKRLWRRVYDSLGASTTITSAATYTKRHYERLLLPYERHIRNDLKRQMDEKNSPIGDSCEQKELLDKTKKKPGLTVSNNKAIMQPSFHTDQAIVGKKQNQVIGRDRNTNDNIAPVSSQQGAPLRVTSTADVKRNMMHVAHSQEMQPVMTMSAVTSASYMQGIPPVSVKSITEESKPWRNKSNASTEPPTTSSSDRRERILAAKQFSQEVTVTQDRKQHRREGIGSHEETSARTNLVYAKTTAAVDTNLNQAIPSQRVSKVVNDDTQEVPPPQQLNTTNKGREVIDLTSEDSPPGVKSRSQTVAQTQREIQEMSKVQRPIIGGGENARQRHFQQSQSKQEQNDSSKHHSTKEQKPKVEGSKAYGVQPYSGQPFNNNKAPPRVHESSPGLTTKKALDEGHPPLKQEGSHPKLDKKRHKQARLENLEGRYTHSPSSESVDEHFAEWLRRQSSGQQQHPKSNTRHHYTPEQYRYSYVSEDLCPPDCSCSSSASRKDEIRPPPPKPKKEHYEEELPFSGMTFYPGRWSPSSMMADHPDLYISSPSAHLQGPPDTLSNHLCTASRIFIPTPPMFTPPYHLGVAPMGPALISGGEDQLHIHPHCLLGSTYPGTSNSRTPEGTNYPLYSFT